jgi:hypothetical protein
MAISEGPHFSTDPVNAYAIEERMKQLGRAEQYAKELSRIATAKKIPEDGLHLINAVALR